MPGTNITRAGTNIMTRNEYYRILTFRPERFLPGTNIMRHRTFYYRDRPDLLLYNIMWSGRTFKLGGPNIMRHRTKRGFPTMILLWDQSNESCTLIILVRRYFGGYGLWFRISYELVSDFLCKSLAFINYSQNNSMNIV